VLYKHQRREQTEKVRTKRRPRLGPETNRFLQRPGVDAREDIFSECSRWTVSEETRAADPRATAAVQPNQTMHTAQDAMYNSSEQRGSRLRLHPSE